MDHLLLYCSYSKEVWWQAFQSLNLDVAIPNSSTSWVEWWLLSRQTIAANRKALFDSVYLLIAWNLWKERNSRFFSRSPSSVTQLLMRIKDEASEWIAADFCSLSGAWGMQAWSGRALVS